MWNLRSTNGWIKGLLISLGVVVFLGLGVSSASAQTGAIEGVVSDAVSSAPIEGAIVMVRGSFEGGQHPGHGGHMVFTDENGAYIVDELEAGEYSVRCGALGYLLTTLSVVVVEGQTTIQDIALEPLAFGSVDGLVTDASSGLPIAGARVTLRPVHDAAGGGDGHWLSAETDSNGMYSIENVLVGEYEIQARVFGYLPNEPEVLSVVQGQTTTVDIALDGLAFGSIEGTVTDAVTGDPIDGAHVLLVRVWAGEGSGDQNDWGWHRTMTDENGFYRLDDVEVAAYRVIVSAPGYVIFEVEIEVLDGQVSVANVALDPLVFGSVEGSVSDAVTGDPVGGALVMILPSWMQGTDGHGGWWMARTDENGFYRFDEIATGEYRLRAFAHGFNPAGADVEIFEGQTATVDFALEPHNRPGMRTR